MMLLDKRFRIGFPDQVHSVEACVDRLARGPIALSAVAPPLGARHQRQDQLVWWVRLATYPAARVRVGLFRAAPARKAELVGVAVFSQPMTQALIPHWTGLEPTRGIELGRMVLWDDVPANGESYLIGRAFRLLAQELPQIHAIVSFSDPMQRVTDSGQQVTGGHSGVVWQATNARHVGRSKARYLIFDRAGHVISERALAKLRNGERGAGYVYEQLRAAGAPARYAGEADSAYLARALADGPFRRVRHPGNLAYVWPSLTAPRGVTAGFRPALAYPKARDVVVSASTEGQQ